VSLKVHYEYEFQKPQLEQFGTTALLGGTLGYKGNPQNQRFTTPQQRDE
jgi:hypothetical protein